MNKSINEILEKQKCKIQLIGKVNYNVYSNGQVIHPATGTILIINNVKLNSKQTWLEFRGIFKDNTEKSIRFSIHPNNIDNYIKFL